MEDYNSNSYGNQGTYNKNTSFNNFNASNDPNNSSAKSNLKLNVVETNVRKDKNVR